MGERSLMKFSGNDNRPIVTVMANGNRGGARVMGSGDINGGGIERERERVTLGRRGGN